MASETVTPIRRTRAPQRILTERPQETAHRVACVLRYLSVHPRDNDLQWTDDEGYGRFLILRDLAAALDEAYDQLAKEAP